MEMTSSSDIGIGDWSSLGVNGYTEPVLLAYVCGRDGQPSVVSMPLTLDVLRFFCCVHLCCFLHGSALLCLERKKKKRKKKKKRGGGGGGGKETGVMSAVLRSV